MKHRQLGLFDVEERVAQLTKKLVMVLIGQYEDARFPEITDS